MITIRLENTNEHNKNRHHINKLLVFNDDTGVLNGIDIATPLNIPVNITDNDKLQKIAPLLDINKTNDCRIIHNNPIPFAYSAPLKVFFDISTMCNLSCPFCLSNSSVAGMAKVSLPNFTTLVKEMGKLGVFMVKLGGGEPFLHPNFWDFVKILREENIFVSASSNGVRISEEDIVNIKKYNLKISISIEGTQKTHDNLRGKGSYEKAFVSLNKLHKAKISKIYTRTTLMQSNLKDVNHVISLAKSFNGIAKFNYCKPSGRAVLDENIIISEKNYKEYLSALHVLNHKDNIEHVSLDETMLFIQPTSINSLKYGELICGAGKKSLHIAADLVASPCIFIRNNNQLSQKQLLINGNINDFWSGELNNDFHIIRTLKKPKDCNNCTRLCVGECPAMRSFFNHGNLLGIDPLCLENIKKLNNNTLNTD